MYKKLILAFLLSFYASIPLVAQGTGNIRGRVVNSSGSPVAGANIILFRNNTVNASTTVTNEGGAFLFSNVPVGEYTVSASALGYLTRRTDSFRLGLEGAVVGDIVLPNAVISLEAVTVTAERSTEQLSLNRNVYRVQELPVTAGGNATDVLRNVPSVEVDTEGEVTLRGTGVVVHLNGRPAPLQGTALANFLRQLPANSIERVEVTTNPNASAEAEGSGGIVNIVTRRDVSTGSYGGIALSVSQKGDGNGSVNFGRQIGPIALNGSLGGMRYVMDGEASLYREDRRNENTSFLTGDTDREMENDGFNITASADWNLSKQNTIFSSVLWNISRGDSETNSVYRTENSLGVATDAYQFFSASESKNVDWDYSLGFRRVLVPQSHFLDANLRFARSQEESDLENFSETLQGNRLNRSSRDDNDESSTESSFQVDYVRPFGVWRFEGGYKATLRWLENDLLEGGVFGENPYSRTDYFDYSDRINAGYVLIGRSFGKFQAQTGLRVEDTRTELDVQAGDFSQSYTEPFPSVSLSYTLDKNSQLRTSYARRLQRPRIWFLSPVVSRGIGETVFTGNPYLEPEFTNSFDIGYQNSQEWGTLQISPFLRHTTNAISQYTYLDSTGISVTTFRNFDERRSYGTDMNATLRSSRLRGSLGGTVFKNETKSEVGGVNAWSWSLRGNAMLTLTEGLVVQGNAGYRAPMKIENGRRGAMVFSQLALRKSLFDNKGSVTLRFNSPLGPMRFDTETEDELFYQELKQEMRSQSLTLAFSYSFGQAPRRQPPRREAEPEDSSEVLVP